MAELRHSHNRPAREATGHRELGGLVRDRLVGRLAGSADYQIGMVVAPAGSGKSRLLAHTAQVHQGPVAWCGTPDPLLRTTEAFVDLVWSAVASSGAAGSFDGPRPHTLLDLVDVLTGAGSQILVVLDDVHLIDGSEAGAALADLVERAPSGTRLLLASRVSLGLDLSRIRVLGRLVEIGPDDLRFRTWEVEELFRDVYRDPLLPEDVAALARRTVGWAAYLQLFFLATNRKPQAERRRVLGSIASRSRLVSEYLGRHVLAGLTPELQEFLIRTSVLRRPTGLMCDEFLGWERGGAELLEELERRQLFTERVDDDAYRYHAVLLSYLDSKLVETVGLAAAGDEHRRAGHLLEREGFMEDALAAFAKSEDWHGVARILGCAGSPATGLGDGWIEALPPTVVATDALLQTVRARRAVARGALADAAQIFRDAESVAVSTAVAERCRIDKELVLAWVEPDGPIDHNWLGIIRRATRRQPVEAHRQAAKMPGVTGRFAEGLTAYIVGDMTTAARLMRAVASHPDAAPGMASGAGLVRMLATVMSGQVVERDDVDRLREEVEASGIPWLDRVTGAVLLAQESGPQLLLDDLVGACEREGDRWGAAVIALLSGIGRSLTGESTWSSIDQASRIFAELGAEVMEAIAVSYVALAAWRSGDRETATRAANHARSLSAHCEAPLGMGLAALVLGLLLDDGRELARARDILGPLGTWEWHWSMVQAAGSEPHPGPEVVAGTLPSSGSTVTGRVRLRCLGGYSLSLGGTIVDESGAKPMERVLLHLLSMRAGEQVHREALIVALWPEADRDAGLHRLQVAISSLRRLLSAAGGDGVQLLARDGDSYTLALPAGSDNDLQNLDLAMRLAAAARSRGDVAGEQKHLAAAVATYSGSLLPGDGPADWVVGPREAARSRYIEAASRLAGLHLHADDTQMAADVARQALNIDPYRDELWKLLIEAAERAGNHAEAGQARRAYDAVLEELGV